MPPSVEDRYQDILRTTTKIETLVEGRSFDEFSSDDMRHLATERLLEIVCEAALKLPDSIKQQAPHINWRGMNNFASLLRHAYHSTDADKVWEIIQNDIPPLKSFAEQRIRAAGK
ncbi:HepT-like ribonuclease domain-containing protein [Tardiphaga sp.]|uniref:HepT-like ribonuclease domain-containing protein n=1 Tax=Tardiphaga sp. TaxID=1926292 RepID=UPI00260EE621|nr:HepT-like ribonuclease domain-containing protein [Tardiphaga sp.]MDB5619176.1 hypothetical protein [Tardiphaga sp.]